MTVAPAAATYVAPVSAWVLAWASLADQVLGMLEHGVKADLDGFTVVSMALGALVIGFVSAGVLRARTVRLAIAWTFLVLAAAVYAAELLGGGGAPGPTILHLVTTVVQVAALWSFCHTDYFRSVRRDPRQRPPLGGLLLIAILVGALGGLVVPGENGVWLSVTV